ncbi:MAG: tRNA adenosine(34) deaminase TadA [Rhodoferax sp.]|uniref:tRNA adenosine(34) deaminase TadA n=1 Tax=Rhodoferax sp. TaxID=50421 RepID=UPI0030193081
MTSPGKCEALTDTKAMQLALSQASLAGLAGEVPVGAVVVRHGQVIAVGRNAPIGQHDPTAHAEMVALRAASQVLGNYRLDDCELFVTLEPCAMCAGTMLHARLKRVVFGASDPKTGAAGSVLDLFANRQLNHHTLVQAGLLAEQSTILLQNFFKDKREAHRLISSPVREDALRTPEARFDDLSAYPWPSHYFSDLSVLSGLRLHFLDEGPRSAPLSYLFLHGTQSWSYFYRHMIPVLLASGARVVAPDLIGFGKSDKPKKESFHQFNWHRQVLLALVEKLDLQNTVLVLQNQSHLLGLSLPIALKKRFCGLLDLNIETEVTDVNDPAYDAPFPDRGHRAALRAFPLKWMATDNSDETPLPLQVVDFWQQRGSGQTFKILDGHLTKEPRAIDAQAAVSFFIPPSTQAI